MITEAEFRLYKFLAVAFALVLTAFCQWLLPLVRKRGEILRNWKTNFLVASVTALITAIFCGACVCSASRFVENRGWGLFNILGISQTPAVVLSVIILDLIAYLWHRANHLSRFLWRFHSVHHSDEIYDASTAIRFHPGEVLISLGVRVAVVSLLGLPVLGILIFEVIYAFFNAFEHGNIRLPSGLSSSLGWVFVTPRLHRLHHASNSVDLNSNFATIFSIWDRLFRTLRQAKLTSEVYSVGLPTKLPYAFSALALIRHPFRRVMP